MSYEVARELSWIVIGSAILVLGGVLAWLQDGVALGLWFVLMVLVVIGFTKGAP